MAVRLCFLLCGLMSASAHAGGVDQIVGGTSWLAWGLGLLCGVALMALTTLDWRRLPGHALAWVKAQRRNAGWAALSLASLAVLALY